MNNQEKVWKVGKWVGILLVIFLAVISIKELNSIKYLGKDVPIMNTITVNGKGEAVSIPDIATFSFSINENAKTVGEAQKKATEKINSTIEAVKDSGVEEKDIKTLSYSINPHYEYTSGVCTTDLGCRPGKSVLSGYDISQSVEVKIRDLDKAGAIFDTIGALGVQNVNGLSFSIDDIDTVKAEARDIAIEDAKVKANELAKKLGVKLVRIMSFYDSSNDVYPYLRGEGMGGDMMTLKTATASIAPQIPAGEQKITSNVSITYEIR